MNLEKRFQEIFNNTTINQNRVDASVKICKEVSVGFAEWVIEKHKQFPDSVLRYDKLYDIYDKEQKMKDQEVNISPKQKAYELYRKISLLIDLNHNEILDVVFFLIDKKKTSEKTNAEDFRYWELVRKEASQIKN